MTLRWRLSIALALAVAAGALVFAVAARATVERLLYQDVDRELQGEVRRVAGDVGGPRPFRRGDGGERPRRFDGRGPGAVFGRQALFARIVDEDGEVLLQTTAAEAIGGLPEPEVDDDERELRLRTTTIDGNRYRIAEAATGDDAIVQVARPLDDVAEFLDTLLWVLAAAGAVALAAALLLAPWLARATLRPVERMTRTARAIAGAPRELSTRVEPAFPDPELREFAEAMNEMLASIDQSDRHQRQFVADASHELRTPLTSLGGNATHLDRTATLDDDARDALDAVRRDVDRLTRIADGLTVLARLDSDAPAQVEPCDVDELVTESLGRLRTVHPEHRFDVTGSVGIQLLDMELLRRIVDNLVDNAARYSPAGSKVAVQLSTAEDGAVRIVVEDDGPGLDLEERDAVLERFRRASTSVGQAGTGLGLPIVADAARALGGSLVLEPVDPHGLRCIVLMRSAATPAG